VRVVNRLIRPRQPNMVLESDTAAPQVAPLMMAVWDELK